VAAASEVRLEFGELGGRGVAVAGGLGQDRQLAVVVLLGAQGVQPLPRGRGGDAGLGGELGGIEPLVAVQLPVT
jgi:hypothetical protein